VPCRPWRPLRASCAAQVGPHAPTCRGAWVPCAVPARERRRPSATLFQPLFSDYDRRRRMTPEDAKPARHAAHASRAEKSAASRQLSERARGCARARPSACVHTLARTGNTSVVPYERPEMKENAWFQSPPYLDLHEPGPSRMSIRSFNRRMVGRQLLRPLLTIRAVIRPRSSPRALLG
jgi:hypothetical protein